MALLHKDNARQTLQALLGAGLGGRDDTPFRSEWQDEDLRPKVHVRVNKDLSIAEPFDDKILEVLPSLVVTQRADPFFGPIFGYLEIALTDQAEAWLQANQPADPTIAQPTINKATFVVIATHFSR